MFTVIVRRNRRYSCRNTRLGLPLDFIIIEYANKSPLDLITDQKHYCELGPKRKKCGDETKILFPCKTIMTTSSQISLPKYEKQFHIPKILIYQEHESIFFHFIRELGLFPCDVDVWRISNNFSFKILTATILSPCCILPSERAGSLTSALT